MGTRDYSAFFQKALATKPEALVITVGGVDRAALMEQIYEFGVYKKTTIVHTLYDYEDVWAAGPKKNFGIHGTEWYYGIDTPAVKAFVAKYKKMFPAAFHPCSDREYGQRLYRAEGDAQGDPAGWKG